MLRPCGLGCHFLGQYQYACSENNLSYDHLALGRILSHPVLFHTAQEMITAEYPPETNGDLGREQGVPESTRMIQDGSHPVEAMEAVESEITG